MTTSRLDAVYRSFLITKFFSKGWGQPENLRRLFEFRKTVSNRDECFKLVERDYPVTITKEEISGDCKLVEGHFLSPLERLLPGIVPPVAQQAHFQAVIPLKWSQPGYKPMCLHLAGTGDHYFWRRRQLMVKPLLKEAGIGGIILENPFYGLRKPSDQVRSSLHNVSDIFVMGGCLILESLVLFNWCERNNLGPLGVTGLSMGGHMASLAATNWPKPLVLVPCLSWSTASAVFLQGVMSRSINWDLLEDQYLSDGVYREKLSKMVTVIDEAFLAGKKFAKKVSQSVNISIKEITSTSDVPSQKENVSDSQHNKTNAENEHNKTNADSQHNKINAEIQLNKTNAESQHNETNVDSQHNKMNAEIQLNKTNADSQHNKASCDVIAKNKSNKENIQPGDQIYGEVSMESDGELKTELENLWRNGAISQSLYEKLSSNAKFELDSKDIGELNKLNKVDILSRIAMKYRIGLQESKYDSAINNAESARNLVGAIIAEVCNVDRLKNETQKPISLDGIAREFQNRRTLDSAERFESLTEKSAAKSDRTANENVDGKNNTKKMSRNITEMTTDILSGLPFVSKSSGKKIDISKIHWRDREALQFMRGIMDECTHLSNFSVPFDTSLIIAVCAKHDAYVPRDDVGTLEEIWPGAEVRYVDAGHVSAYLLHQSMFRSCIIEAFERSKRKWKDGKHIA